MRLKIAAILPALLGLFVATSSSAATCEEIVSSMQHLSHAQASQLAASGHNGKTYKSLFGECDAHNTYDGVKTPAPCKSDPSNVAGVWKYPDGALVFASKAAVDADGSQYSKTAHWPNNPETSLRWDSTKKSLDAENVSFIVLPLPDGKSWMARDAGLRKGDLAVAVSGGRCSVALVGDFGPFFKLGEISMKTHADLGNPQCAHKGEYPCKALVGRHSQGIGLPAVTYIVFPNSRPKNLTPETFAAASDATLERAKGFLAKYK